MQMCQTHWDKLKARITEEGLMKFVSNSGEQAIEKTLQQSMGDDSNATYDPLMAANMAIWGNLLSQFGIGVMAADAPPCLLCFMDEAAKNGCGDPDCTRKHDSGMDWIEYAVRDQVEEAKKRGLLSSAVN
ncbi:MAG TPA: hypothetical protein VFW94_23845 [Candidatus Acidoferrales bacterium]|nr:hypothetical protein [Candidatus Acidoferrales bacterium]